MSNKSVVIQTSIPASHLGYSPELGAVVSKSIRVDGDIVVLDENGLASIGLVGKRAYLYLGTDAEKIVEGEQGTEGDLHIRDTAGRDVFSFDGKTATLSIGKQGHGGTILLLDDNGREVFKVDPGKAALYVGNSGNEGDVIVRNAAGVETLKLDGEHCATSVRNAAGTETLKLDGEQCAIIVRNAAGAEMIKLDGKVGDVLLLGADCAEEFDVAAGEVIDAGTVLVIHDEGSLRPSTQAYDRRVAGVVSGAGGVNPGIVLGRSGVSNNRQPIALSGKVYCKVEADSASIRVGDLLTTSAVPGHAMKASDATQAFGAVIGKALRPLESGRGLIPILVALQ